LGPVTSLREAACGIDVGGYTITVGTLILWCPFGGGRRNCIRFALAQMELTLLIARLAQRLDITSPATAKPRPVGMVVNRPDGCVPFQVIRRA